MALIGTKGHRSRADKMIEYVCAGNKHAILLKGGEGVAKHTDDESVIDRLCEGGLLIKKAEKYISFCLETGHKKPRLPNICGFLRWLKLGALALDKLKKAYPEKFRTLLMLFEDEALNSELPPSIISTYMKQSFARDDGKDEEVRENCGPITLIFDHDIKVDGQ